jgi:hypothetical protein
MDVAEYVLQHRSVPGHVLAEDAGDLLDLADALEAKVVRIKLAAIRLARSAGLSWHQIAERQGFATPGGAYQLFQRLTEQQASGRRDEVAARQRAKNARLLAENPARIRDCAAVVSAGVTSLPADENVASVVEDLLEAVADDAAPGSVLALLRLAADAHDLAAPHAHSQACRALAEGAALADQWDEEAGSRDY